MYYREIMNSSMMNAPEHSGPESWTQDPGAEFETQNEKMEVLDERTKLARDYVTHYLEGASPNLEDAAMSLINAQQSDLENENYWKVGLPERLQLKSNEVDRLTEFVAQLKADRGWSTEVTPEATSPQAEAGGVAGSETAEAAIESGKLFTDKAEAREVFLAQAEALARDLDTIERNDEYPLQMLEELMSVLKGYAVEMELEDGRVVRGLPLTLADSGVPEAEWDDWGRSDRVSTGALPTLRTQLDQAIRRGGSFTARQVLAAYYPAAVERTIDRLFNAAA